MHTDAMSRIERVEKMSVRARENWYYVFQLFHTFEPYYSCGQYGFMVSGIHGSIVR